ncbi:HigA family addiction module antitoxin [Synechocystis sp. CS-94]|nr:HigA family addiction module antitoxin [Synechocystis sp. CS-94]
MTMINRPINRMRPVHPGEILREDFLEPLDMSINALALALNVPPSRIHEIIKERRAITADTAERLARYFGGDGASWLNLQAIYDLKTLPNRDEIMQRIQPRISEHIA